MTLISDALAAAFDRFRRYGGIIVGFAVVLVSMNLGFRLVSNAAVPFGPLVSSVMVLLGFGVAVYLSFVALRFSYRALDEPVFDLSATVAGFFRLFVGQVILAIVSIPYVFVPLVIGAAYIAPQVPDVPELLVAALAPFATLEAVLVAAPLVLLSFYVSVRLSMASFRIVVRGDDPFTALSQSWTMTRGSFWQVCGYLLIPFGVLLVLAAALGLVSLPLSASVVGEFVIALLGLILYAAYVLVVDPTLAIGKAKLFESLDARDA